MSGDGEANYPESDVDPAKWYSDRFELYSSFTRLLHATIENLMRADEIYYLAVTSRTKAINSFVEKMIRKGYTTTSKATDLAGIRVITFIESEAAAAVKLLQRSFVTHSEKSLDKSEELGDSQVGYRSIHLVCELAADRAHLPEYKPFQGLLFEIQVRTVLQHAWAEIDHDRGYKFSGVLPRELRRRLNLLAGQLELADKEFSRLAGDVDSYSAELQEKKEAGNLNVELSSSSLSDFLTDLSNKYSLSTIEQSSPRTFAGVIDELNRFGVHTLKDVQKLMSPKFIDDLRKISIKTNQVGLLRKAMMYDDIDGYFTKAWNRNWDSMTSSSRKLLSEKWGKEKVQLIKETFLDSESPTPD